MAATLNPSNKKISAASFFGGDKVEKYRLELISEGKIPGTKLNATPEERKQAFGLYRKNKIDFKNFVEKVLQKQVRVQKIKTGGIKRLSPGKVGGALARISPQQDTPKSSFGIIKVLDSILATLQNQFKFDKKKSASDKKEEESDKRSKREGALEAVKKISRKIIDKVVAPFKSIIDRIWNFIFYTLLGRAFTKLMDWLGDPKNSKKIAVLGRFLKDWWPALLGLYFMPFKGFMVKTLGRIAWFAARFALFNPAGAAATLGVGSLIAANEVTGQRKAAKVQAENKAKAQTGKGLGVQGIGGVGDLGPTTPYGLLQGASGGGLINSNTGTKISGAGPDTQLTALMPGEIVMNRAAVKGIGADKLLSLNAQYGGSNANKPKYSSNIQFAADGGMIGASKSTNTPTLSPIEIKFASRARQRGITDPTELKAFLSQVKHESGGFGAPKREKYNSSPNDPPGKPGYEYFKGYANPKLGRGNRNADDAYKYSGRGYLQITGRANYDDIGRKIGKNLVDNPQLMMNSDVALDASIEYWKSRVRPKVKNWNNTFDVSRAVNKPSAMSPDEIVGMKDRQQTFQKYNQISNKTIASLTAPRPRQTSSKKSGFIQNVSQNLGNFANSLFNIQPAYAKKIGGGLIKENTGMNIAGAAADRQRIDVQPGEYVLPVDTVSNLGISLIDKLVAMTDSNSTAAKLGKRSSRYTPGPLSRAGRGGMMTLPPISQPAGGSMGAPASGTSIPSFSAVSPSGGAERSMNASIYGIVG